jgi:GNAT superfamily N-acetyltransferase
MTSDASPGQNLTPGARVVLPARHHSTHSIAPLVNNPLQLVHTLNDSQINDLVDLYHRQWWSQGRTLEDVRTMLAHSSRIYALIESDTGRLVAFCRVLTDFVFRGLLNDVMVDESRQGQGIGRRLMEAVARDADLARVQSIGLWCKPHLVPLYEKFGFEVGNTEYCWMQTGSLTAPTPG